jgi:hypothetical protein
MADVQWYYARNDQQFGPVSANELKVLADAGRLAPDDLLWREGMEQWATAINLTGLFASEIESTPSSVGGSQANVNRPVASPIVSPSAAAQATASHSIGTSVRPPRQVAPRVALHGVLRTTQLILWTTCVLVVLLGMVLFTRAFLKAETPEAEAMAAAVFATFFIGAYVLARSGEKLSRLLLSRRKR